jgi:hypothetical protein
MSHRIITLVVATLLVLLAMPASADQAVDGERPPQRIELDPVQVAADIAASQTAWEQRPLSLTLHMGVGTPLGGLGVEVEHSVTRNLALHGGVGMGRGGAQVAAGARFRHNASRTLSMGFGVGVSGGDYHELSFHAPGYEWKDTIWINAEVFVEKRVGPLALRAYAGWSNAVSHGECVDTEDGGPCSSTYEIPNYPHVGVAIGWSW